GHYAQKIVQRNISAHRSVHCEIEETPVYETINVNSVKNTRSRTIGAEHAGLSAFAELGFEGCLNDLGFSNEQIKLAALAIVGKLVYPTSERGTREWARQMSGIGELLDFDVNTLSNNALYRISDLLYSHKQEIERVLLKNEKNLFSLNDKIILYDLTNTYFEGDAKSNKKAKRGRSKEKRSDCPLVTLGLVVDEMGFIKTSKTLPGNVSEPGTLLSTLQTLQNEEIDVRELTESEIKKRGITVIMDAGIATEDNLNMLFREGYDYIVVARNKPLRSSEIDTADLVNIKDSDDARVDVALFEGSKENVLLCKSSKRLAKESAMMSQYQERFEKGLEDIRASLTKKGGVKRYDKVIERIGRLKEKYSSIGRFYKINTQQSEGKVIKLTWTFEKKEAEEQFSGLYFLRTTRKDLSGKKMWSLYTMLTRVEESFRCLKDDLNMRPVFHQKEHRTDSHIFITILAYHLLNSIQVKLHKVDIAMRWKRIRALLSTHVIITTSMVKKDGGCIHIRGCSEPESFHRKIYDALSIKKIPVRSKILNM
ncbi:IS1634 family transposase, partial [bacterium]|nr:IS1634 family transposase [bacterium]